MTDVLVVMGGEDELRAESESIEYYDAEENCWRSGPNMQVVCIYIPENSV